MNTKKLFVNSCIAASILTSSMFANAGEVEGNVSLATDYVFRGFSQTMEDPAISGGFDYSFDNGFSLGTWASNVDFGTDTSSEIDLYGGYSFKAADGVTVDLSYLYYIYEGQTENSNYSEFYATVNLNDLSLGIIYSPDYFGSDEDAVIFNVDYSITLSENFGLDLHAGYSDVEDDIVAAGVDSYVDYSAALTTSTAGVDLALTYYGTDVDDNDLADDRVVFSISKSF